MDGKIEHSAEWIEKERGKFLLYIHTRVENYLEKDKGSVFMYHHYEKTTLLDVKQSLLQSMN